MNGSVQTLVQGGLERYRFLETKICEDMVMWWCVDVEVKDGQQYIHLQL